MINHTEAARSFLDEGMNPIPAKKDKSPNLAAGLNILHEPYPNDFDFSVFERSYGIGIACGGISGGIECIDFDCHQGQNISEIFTKYINDPYIQEMINTGLLAVYSTPSGGYHVVIKSEHYGSSQTLSRYADNNVMIEVRGNGSYFVTFPTPGYNKINGVDIVKLSECEKEDRDYLFDLAKTFNLGTREDKPKNQLGRKWPEKFDDNSIFGHFNNTAEQELFNLLTEKGWVIPDRPIPTKDGVTYFRRPGKDKGISATFGHFHNMFYSFSDSEDAAPFEKEKSYTICDVFIKMKFNDDFQEFKEWLAKKYEVNIPTPVKPSIERFPIDVFPKSIQEFISEMNLSLNYNIDFLSVAFLFTFATLNGNRSKLKVKNGWMAPTIFWSIAVGEPGTMKTHPLSTVIGALQGIDRTNKKRYDQDLDVWETNMEDQKTQKQKATASKEPKPVFRQILINDYTLEALHEVHNFNPNGIGLYRDEIVGFLHDMNKYRRGSDEQFWLESFNNKSYIINRVSKRPLLIDNININIVGSIQPDVLMNVISDSGNNGLVDRFLFTIAETEIKPMTLVEMSEDWLEWWKIQVSEIYEMILAMPENYVYHMSDAAKDYFVTLDKKMVDFQLSEDEPASIKNYVSKMKTYIPRFALLTYLIDGWFGELSSQTVDLIHMQKAERIAEYFINSARYVLTENSYKKEIRSVNASLNGKTNSEKIQILSTKGYKNKDIAKELGCSPAYVSKILKELREKLTEPGTGKPGKS
jgi:hypothetical protein